MASSLWFIGSLRASELANPASIYGIVPELPYLKFAKYTTIWYLWLLFQEP